VIPFSNLDKQTIELSYDDVSPFVRFSTLEYQDQKSTRY
jgi:hypothetical protein